MKVEVTKTKEYEIRKTIGKDILEDYVNDYDTYIDVDEEILFEDLDSKNAVVFLYELKKQLNEEIDNYINSHFRQDVLSLTR